MGKGIEKHPSESAFPGFPRCFVCGEHNPKGLRTQFSVDGDGVRASFIPDETHVGYEDTVHGGIISALLDEAIIWAGYASTGRFGVTAELNVRFIGPLAVGEKYTVMGRVTENRGRLWIVEAEIFDEQGQRLAKADGKVLPKS